MELERTPIISIRTGEAVKSVKELKQNIQDLKDKIVELRNAEQDCSKETLELQASQRELNAVNGLTKSSTDAVAGSYADLLNQLKEARDAWKQIPQFIDGELNPAYTEATNKVRSLTQQVATAEQSIGDWHRNVGNYQSAFDGLASGAGKLAQGMSSIAGTFGIATQAGTPFGKVMDRLKSSIGILNSVSGILGMVRNMGSLNTATRQNTTATVANTVAKGAETTATWTLKGAIDALKASMTLGLSAVVDFVVTGLSLLVPWLTSAKDASDDLTTSTYDSADAFKTLKTAYDDLLSEDSHQIALLRARGATEKEIHEQRQKNYEKEIAEAERLKGIEENRERTSRNIVANSEKESVAWKAATEDAEKASKAAQDYADKIKDLRTEQRREQELYDASLQKPKSGSGTGNKTADEAMKQALKDAEYLRKLGEQNLTEYQKLVAKFDAVNAELDAIEARGNATAEEMADARIAVEEWKAEELREFYRKQYTEKYENYKKSADLLRKEIDETERVYKGLIPVLRDTWDERLALDQAKRQENVRRLEFDKEMAMSILKDAITDDQKAFYEQFKNYSDQQLKDLYHQMLNGLVEVEEPFKEALKTIVPNILASESEDKARLEQYVKDLMKAYEDAVNNGEVDEAEVIRKKLLGDPPIASDEELTNACNDFIARFAKKLAEAERKQKPFYKIMKGTSDFMESYGEATANLLDNTADAWEALLELQVKNNKIGEEQARKSFNTMKSLQYASAIIQTAGAVTKALATAPNYIIGAIQAAAALATGTAQIAKIASTEFNGSGGGYNTGAPSVMQPTPVVPTVGLNSLDYAEALGQVDTRVYVLESDITDAQNKQKVRVEESTF